MEVGDKVIINPNTQDLTYSKYGYSFYKGKMLKPGVFTLERAYDRGGFYIGACVYDEEWLLPVPLFKKGDTVKIRKNLRASDSAPYGVNEYMEKAAGQTLEVTKVRCATRDINDLGDDGYEYSLNDYEYCGGLYIWSSPMFDLTNYKHLKTLHNESRLQKQESPLRGGSREFTGGICCRKHKPRVTVKSVSYKKVIGRG